MIRIRIVKALFGEIQKKSHNWITAVEPYAGKTIVGGGRTKSRICFCVIRDRLRR